MAMFVMVISTVLDGNCVLPMHCVITLTHNPTVHSLYKRDFTGIQVYEYRSMVLWWSEFWIKLELFLFVGLSSMFCSLHIHTLPSWSSILLEMLTVSEYHWFFLILQILMHPTQNGNLYHEKTTKIIFLQVSYCYFYFISQKASKRRKIILVLLSCPITLCT